MNNTDTLKCPNCGTVNDTTLGQTRCRDCGSALDGSDAKPQPKREPSGLDKAPQTPPLDSPAIASTETPRFYYANAANAVVGPITDQELRTLAHAGTIVQSTQVCAVGTTEWKPYSVIAFSRANIDRAAIAALEKIVRFEADKTSPDKLPSDEIASLDRGLRYIDGGIQSGVKQDIISQSLIAKGLSAAAAERVISEAIAARTEFQKEYDRQSTMNQLGAFLCIPTGLALLAIGFNVGAGYLLIGVSLLCMGGKCIFVKPKVPFPMPKGIWRWMFY